MPFRLHPAAALLIFFAFTCPARDSFAQAPPVRFLPPTAPTSAPAAPQPATSQPAAPQLPLTPGQQSPTRAIVSLAAGQLSVRADNSSLNQILRDISRVTGLKVTGGVIDERVYGTYGPASTAAILAALLNGTGSNMLLVEAGGHAPQELVLTPRQGGPTPPNPNATRELGETDLPPGLSHRSTNDDPQGQPFPPPAPRLNPFNRPRSTEPSAPMATTNAAAPTDTPAATPADPTAPATTTTDQSPNGVKTPQQIYEQLLRLQQQQDKTTPPQP